MNMNDDAIVNLAFSIYESPNGSIGAAALALRETGLSDQAVVETMTRLSDRLDLYPQDFAEVTAALSAPR